MSCLHTERHLFGISKYLIFGISIHSHLSMIQEMFKDEVVFGSR